MMRRVLGLIFLLGLVVAYSIPADAAIQTVTITFGQSGSAGFSMSDNSLAASLSGTVGTGVSLSVTPTCPDANCFVSTLDTPMEGPGIGVFGSMDSSPMYDGMEGQLDGGMMGSEEWLTLTFAGINAPSVTLTQIVLTEVGDDDGAIIQCTSCSPIVNIKNTTDLTPAPPSDTYNSSTDTYTVNLSPGVLGTIFTFTAPSYDDYLLRSVTFQYDDAYSAIPEPAAALLFGSGMLLVFGAARLRSRRLQRLKQAD